MDRAILRSHLQAAERPVYGALEQPAKGPHFGGDSQLSYWGVQRDIETPVSGGLVRAARTRRPTGRDKSVGDGGGTRETHSLCSPSSDPPSNPVRGARACARGTTVPP